MGRPVRAARQKAIERVQSKSRQDNQNVFDSGSDEGGDLTGILPSETDSDSDRYANSDDEYKISKEEKLELEREDDEEVLDSMDDEVSESELHEVRKRSRKIVKGKDAEVDVGEGDSDEV
ncbi:hypothetical protein SARC_09679 [Sphaeroforma arctica JP610]|uniref:Uncharacterized protein n=1 Tax=Sphaeroforma arctica JP610 TaxID=667725 RepID=A0A0L0FM56_9EUKA|nr:hypothetical protein SARC_09679 [Sphaeroforma arctica JP610]KNC77869.1 hypothetical protein SARC_09679 [Sphaeroforma arctica JP610]|eukprot:XP_014151771.1 hypothetical protein SARC_09679 [Sphaeroforma arctica JP610]